MARLIDADALNKELQKRVGSPTDDKLYEVNLCIINAPTIDAIPVAWLKEKTHHPDNHTQGSAKWMLGCWKREQEAR